MNIGNILTKQHVAQLTYFQQSYFQLIVFMFCFDKYNVVQNNRCYNSNFMKNLAYIPTKIDKIKIYNELQALKQVDHQENKETINSPSIVQLGNNKKLSKEQMNELIQRLTKNTKKQYNTEQQKTHILAVNLQLKKRRQQGQKVQNRLLDYGKKISQKKIELAKELQAQKKQKFFREVPEITEKAKNINQRTIDKRLDQIIQKKIYKRQELIEKYQPIFQPSINPQSEFINDLQNYGNLQNRMQIREKQAIKRKESLTKDIQTKKKQQYTFHPNINNHSKIIAQKIPRRPLSVITPKHKQSNTEPEVDKQIYPFAPNINKNTEELINKKGSIVESDCFRRLYNNAKDMLTKQQQKIQQRNRAHTFQPQLNNHSLRLAASINKKTKEQTIQPSIKTQEEYEQIKIGNGNDYSRAKCYSVRNANEQRPQKYINIMHRNVIGSINWLR